MFYNNRFSQVAGTVAGITVILNGLVLPIKCFEDYIRLYVADFVHLKLNEHWEIGIAMSNRFIRDVSFVNSIATTKGGQHLQHVRDDIRNKIRAIKKKVNFVVNYSILFIPDTIWWSTIFHL